MRDNITLAIAVLAIIAAFVYLEPAEQPRMYDCNMIDWLPDVPHTVKEECRRRALEYLKTQKDRLTV